MKHSSFYGMGTTGVWVSKPLLAKMLRATLEYEINYANASKASSGVLINP